MPGSVFSQSPFEDQLGLRWTNGLFGDLIVAQRRDLVSSIFTYGLPSQSFQQIRLWDTAGGAGAFNVNEHVVGGTSGAVGIIEVVASPSQIRTLQGAFVTGETITGIGITAAISGATRVLTADLAGNGDITTASSVLLIDSGTDTTSSIAIESAQLASYAAGHDLFAYFTAAFDAAGAGAAINQFLGPFVRGGSDGYGVGYNGVNFGFVNKRASAINFTARTAWSIDPMDGTGPSGMTIVPGNLNIYGIKIGYLGIAGAVLYVIDTSQRWWPVHQEGRVNSGTTTTVLDPHLTMRGEITKTVAGATTSRIRSASWSISSVGPSFLTAQRYNTFVRAPVTQNSGAERYACSILNNLTFGGVSNRTQVRLTHISVTSDASVGNNQLVRIRKNAPLTGAAVPWTAVTPVADSCVSTDITATGGFTAGTVVFGFPAVGQQGAEIDLTEQNITIDPGETLTVTSETTSNQVTRIALRWEEAL